MIAYAALRLVVERFRGDAIRGVWGGVSTSSAIALIAALLAAGWLAHRGISRKTAR